jgi:hypothetical protein
MRHRLGRFARIALGAAMLAGPVATVAHAQDTNPNAPMRTDYNRRYVGDFGLFGLVGLFGLFGLRRDRSRVYPTTTAQTTRHA